MPVAEQTIRGLLNAGDLAAILITRPRSHLGADWNFVIWHIDMNTLLLQVRSFYVNQHTRQLGNNGRWSLNLPMQANETQTPICLLWGIDA